MKLPKRHIYSFGPFYGCGRGLASFIGRRHYFMHFHTPDRERINKIDTREFCSKCFREFKEWEEGVEERKIIRDNILQNIEKHLLKKYSKKVANAKLQVIKYKLFGQRTLSPDIRVDIMVAGRWLKTLEEIRNETTG